MVKLLKRLAAGDFFLKIQSQFQAIFEQFLILVFPCGRGLQRHHFHGHQGSQPLLSNFSWFSLFMVIFFPKIHGFHVFGHNLRSVLVQIELWRRQIYIINFIFCMQKMLTILLAAGDFFKLFCPCRRQKFWPEIFVFNFMVFWTRLNFHGFFMVQLHFHGSLWTMKLEFIRLCSLKSNWCTV